VLATLAIVGAALAAFTTESRTGLLVLPVAPAIYVALSPSVPRRGRIIALSVAVAAAFGALVFANTLLPEERRFSNLDTIDSRYSIWGEALHDVADHPIIGLGYAVSRSARWGESIHNELLGRLVDGGVLHAAAFVAVLLVMTRMGLQLWRAEDQRYSAVGVGMLAALAVLVMYMQVSATWVSSSVSAILSWMFFGIATAFVEGLRADQRAQAVLERPALGTRRDTPRFRPTARRSPR
jgi:O-antigen ligase